MRAWRRLLLLALALTVALTPALLTSVLSSGDARAATRPNIVLITTDDMTVADLAWMPTTRSLLARAGVTVDDFISNHPLCCPARAQILTGQYGQNNGVHSNTHPQSGGFRALRLPGEHIGTWLQRAGYRTAFVGKYLNGWDSRPSMQPGWSIFDPFVQRVYSPYGITMYRNGSPVRVDGVHTADLVGRTVVRYVDRFAGRGLPFFIWASQVPPHGMLVRGAWRPPVPAQRHRGLFAGVTAPSVSDPSFREADVSDKPAWVQQAGPVDVDRMSRLHRARIRSLQAVDEQVRALVAALDRNGVLQSTYIMFTSDNGYLLGEHGLRGKNVPYEPSLRVPLLVRGPGLPARVVRSEMFGTVDIAPTLLDMSGATAGRTVDGRSMLPALRDGAPGYDRYLVQAGTGERDWWWRGVRSADYSYVRYDDGAEELYDRQSDPFQLQNVADDPAYTRVLREYAAQLDRLADCAGPSCHAG